MKKERITVFVLTAALILCSFTGMSGSLSDWKFRSKSQSEHKHKTVKLPVLKTRESKLIILPVFLKAIPVLEDEDSEGLLMYDEDGEGGDDVIPSAELYEVWNNLEVNPYKTSLDSVLVNGTDIDFTGFTYPLPVNYRVTSEFGPRRYRYHYGIDLKLEIGDSVVSVLDGMVRIAKKMKGYGNFVLIRHHNGMESFYGHLNDILVEPDQAIKSGDLIGFGGNTGRSTGPHLHFELRYLGLPINPRDIVDFDNLCVKADTITLSRENLKYPQRMVSRTAAARKSTKYRASNAKTSVPATRKTNSNAKTSAAATTRKTSSNAKTPVAATQKTGSNAKTPAATTRKTNSNTKTSAAATQKTG